MNLSHWGDVQVGFALPPFTAPAVTRTTLALYAGASGDHNQVHIDLDFARKARQPDVFAHGMLSVAYLGRLLTAWVAQRQIRSLSVRFTGITQLGHVPTCSGEVIQRFDVDGEARVRLAIRCGNQYGEHKLVGEAVVALT
ncbi:MaoC/PaaZ C-terminal domain-containing protein [Pseudomonas sp. NPDC087612]|uniref:MaoC/PaaZ C-terminal domain-containing protein n=1 Tax=unclassified Pseudomonas TaxID=196821 RepID=UPI0005EAF4F0|nr:MaoC/PaaZ C-terminal domain-containing protein [Pseudomonas sp. 2(2015)]KJK16815.1 dehydratase [Pseudomonas sp. 2(2015)]